MRIEPWNWRMLRKLWETIMMSPRINYRGWKAMPFIIGNETFEKLGAVGTLANLLIYLTSVFNMKNITAATIINIFNGTANFGTMIGALSCLTPTLGLQAIQLTAAIPTLHPPHCAAEKFNELAASGHVTWQFGADQFNPNTESGKRGINSFFNWYFCTFTFAQMVSLTLIVYVQSNMSWAIGLAIPALLMLVACVVFFMGTKNICLGCPATGSPMTSVAQVIVVAVKKRQLKQPDQPLLSLFNYIPPGSINCKLRHTDQFRMKAAEK
ncbi:hypothetical protein CUMW_041050 [Citrus unshiu]|nr:hypothetical protein CUMW_041050 [Citrus unshiu]